ncbi:hypothetical protein RJ641_007271 [Dillenia turbinata]|uniref:F-box domain-containing protein n=1 Tax=Dillenia turbinata TaxID=194707 RepID=A0AAN8VA17_9MAGN
MNFEDEQQDEIDHFDRLPDPLVLLIFNKIHDHDSLFNCLSVSKRFNSLLPQIDDLFIKLHRRAFNFFDPDEDDRHCCCSKPKSNSSKNPFKHFLRKPLKFIHKLISPNPSSTSPNSNPKTQSPDQILKNFREIQSLKLQLPSWSGILGSNVGCELLKWRAEFGAELEKCAIIAAESFYRENNFDENKKKSSNQELFEQDLNLRVMWTVSCLIAASARHRLLQKMIKDHEKIKNVTVSDSEKQGTLRMNEEQIRKSCFCSSNSEEWGERMFSEMERSRIPNVRVRLWYVPKQELKESGHVMEGATLIVINPIDKISDDDGWISQAFDGDEEENPLKDAVEVMIRSELHYVLEINSF